MVHASFDLRGDPASVGETHPSLGEALEAPVSTISTRGFHRCLKPADDEVVLHWHMYVGF